MDANEELNVLYEASPWHDTQGEWTDPEVDRGSYSLGGKKYKRKTASRKTSATKTPCGRHPAKYKCKSGKLKEAEVEVDTPEDESVIVAPGNSEHIYDCAKQRQSDKVVMRKLKQAVKDARKSGATDCGLGIDDAIKIINTLELASKGKAFDKSKDE